jgi:translation initiation factor IF-2
LGKIELENPKAEVPAVEPVIAPEESKKEEIQKIEPKKEESVELKVLDKIDLSKIESNKPKPSPKKEENLNKRLQNLKKRNFQSQK